MPTAIEVVNGGVMFIKGDFQVCHCGRVADLLCDHPMGEGKTCDIPLCDTCALEIGTDMHVCKIHRMGLKPLADVDLLIEKVEAQRRGKPRRASPGALNDDGSDPPRSA